MPKKKTPAEKPSDQFKRFVETAREHGVDENGNDIDLVFRDMSRRPAKSKPKKQPDAS